MAKRRTTAAKRSTETPVETQEYELIGAVCFAGRDLEPGDTVELSGAQAEIYRREKLIGSDGEEEDSGDGESDSNADGNDGNDGEDDSGDADAGGDGSQGEGDGESDSKEGDSA